MTGQVATPLPVGQILGKELDERHWTQGDFAEVLRRPVQFVSEIVNGRKEITRESAAQIAAALGQTPVINPTGNALLATAGTGDVLAGMVGARLASLRSQHIDTPTTRAAVTFQAACEAVYVHGLVADEWPAQRALTASRLAQAVQMDI